MGTNVLTDIANTVNGAGLPGNTPSLTGTVVNSNYGSTFQTGFAEVQFDGTPAQPQSTPEPSSLVALIALGLAGVGLRKRI